MSAGNWLLVVLLVLAAVACICVLAMVGIRGGPRLAMATLLLLTLGLALVASVIAWPPTAPVHGVHRIEPPDAAAVPR